MSPTVFDHISRQCPLRIDSAAWEDPALVLKGANWSVSATSPWRITRDGRFEVGYEDPDAASAIFALRGALWIGAESVSTPAVPDLRMRLEGNRSLEILVGGRIEPWLLRLPSGPILVPSPTDAQWFHTGGP